MRTVEIITNVVLVLMMIGYFMGMVDSVQALTGSVRFKHALNDVAPGSSMPICPIIPIIPESRTSLILGLLSNLAIFVGLGYLLIRRSKIKGMPSYTTTTVLMGFSMVTYLFMSVMMTMATSSVWTKGDSSERAGMSAATVVFYALFASFLALVIVRSK